MDVKYKIIDGRVEEIRQVIVHEFTMGDVDDPDLYAAQPLWEWEQTDKGQWVMHNAYEKPVWYRLDSYDYMGYKYIIKAKFCGAKLTEYLLKYGNKI